MGQPFVCVESICKPPCLGAFKHQPGCQACSAVEKDRYGPNLGGCCAGLAECAVPLSKDNGAYCKQNSTGWGKTCFSTKQICKLSCPEALPAQETAQAPPTPQFPSPCEWIPNDNCIDTNTIACQCRQDNPQGPCTPCAGNPLASHKKSGSSPQISAPQAITCA